MSFFQRVPKPSSKPSGSMFNRFPTLKDSLPNSSEDVDVSTVQQAPTWTQHAVRYPVPVEVLDRDGQTGVAGITWNKTLGHAMAAIRNNEVVALRFHGNSNVRPDDFPAWLKAGYDACPRWGGWDQATRKAVIKAIRESSDCPVPLKRRSFLDNELIKRADKEYNDQVKRSFAQDVKAWSDELSALGDKVVKGFISFDGEMFRSESLLS